MQQQELGEAEERRRAEEEEAENEIISIDAESSINEIDKTSYSSKES